MGASSDVEEILPVITGDMARRLRRTQWTGVTMAGLLGTLLLFFAAGRLPVFQHAQSALDFSIIIAGAVYMYGIGAATWVYFGRLAGKQVSAIRLTNTGLTSELQRGGRVMLMWADRSTRLTITDWRPSNPAAAVTVAWKAGGDLMRARVSRADATRIEGRAKEKGWGVRTENKVKGSRTWIVKSLRLDPNPSES